MSIIADHQPPRQTRTTFAGAFGFKRRKENGRLVAMDHDDIVNKRVHHGGIAGIIEHFAAWADEGRAAML